MPSGPHPGTQPKENRMKTSIKIRAVALVASVVLTFTLVHEVAEYAYPEAAVVLASAEA
jgi:hypothetical protein